MPSWQSSASSHQITRRGGIKSWRGKQLRAPERKEEVIAQFLEFVRTNSIEWAKAGQIVASKDILESDDYQQYPQSFFTSTPEEEETLYIFDYVYFSYVLEALDVYSTDIAYGELDMDEGLATMQQYVEDKIAEVAR